MTTINDIPDDAFEHILKYLLSDSDKVSFMTTNKENTKNPYIKQYLEKLRDNVVLQEAIEEQINSEYNDLYSYSHIDEKPTEEQFREHWLNTRKQDFMDKLTSKPTQKPTPKPTPKPTSKKKKSKKKNKKIKKLIKLLTRKKSTSKPTIKKKSKEKKQSKNT